MFASNPFADLTVFLRPLVLQIYIVVMIVAVVIGTWFDTYHKGSAKFFAHRKEEAKARAQRRPSPASSRRASGALLIS